MIRYLVAALVSGGLLLSSGVAHAQENVIREADRVVYKQTTVVDFNEVTLEGELTRPEGSYMMNRRRSNFSSLIKLRDNFLPELQKSVDNL